VSSRPLRAAIYVRMSTTRQADSPERQRASILPYCERKNYQVVMEYEDLAVRGDADRRPGFERLLAGPRRGCLTSWSWTRRAGSRATTS
jgi:DNA invertase Pin-like site-specific DNA recombinase